MGHEHEQDRARPRRATITQSAPIPGRSSRSEQLHSPAQAVASGLVQRQAPGAGGASSAAWTLDGFAAGSDALTAEHEAVIRSIAEDLNANGVGIDGYVTITGHDDPRGTGGLAQQRADRVRTRLVASLRDPQMAGQIRAQAGGADLGHDGEVQVTIMRGAIRGSTPQVSPPDQRAPHSGLSASALMRSADQLLPALLRSQRSGRLHLPPNFWTLPSPHAVPHDLLRELSQWITGEFGRERVAAIAARIAEGLGMNRAEVFDKLNDLMISGGVAGLKQGLESLVEAIAGPPATPPPNPYGPPEHELPSTTVQSPHFSFPTGWL